MGMVSAVIISMMGSNNNKMDEDGNVLDEAEEIVHMIRQWKCHHSQHIDPTTQFLQDCMDFWTHMHR